jgi:hypothetical protein
MEYKLTKSEWKKIGEKTGWMKEAKKKKWIQEAVHHEGRFTEYCKRNGFDGPSQACADKAMKSEDASVRGMAQFYMNVARK